MSRTSFACPACKVTLNPRKYLPAGKRLVCPYCDSRFSLPVDLSPPVPVPGREVNELRETDWSPSTPAPESRLPAPINEPLSIPAPPDLTRLYRRFTWILIGTIVVLSAGFGTALYLVAKDRAKYQSALSAKNTASTPESRGQFSLQAGKEKEEEKQRAAFRE